MIIFVGSQNPVKINAVIGAASESWPNVRVLGLDVPSGIRDQPMTDAETRQGAENRALAALEDGLVSLQSDKASQKSHQEDQNSKSEIIGLGLEGGVFTAEDGTLWNTVWAAVADSDGFLVAVNGERFELKDPIAKEIKSGKEMGPVLSSMTGVAEINKKHGMIGVVTGGVSDRTEVYSGLAKLAIGLWYGRNWPSSLRSAAQ
jgi:non-canonical (house-cleaning) NTP pyrophosphatase